MPLNRSLPFLRELVDARVAKGEHRLPTVAAMATMAGLSKVSVWKAVAMLRREGLLVGHRGSHIAIASLEPLQRLTAATEPRTKCQRMAARLRAGVLGGAYLPGEQLPSAKELSHAHGAAYRTVHKALLSLAADGLLQQRGRGFEVARLSAGRPSGVVVLVAGADPAGSLTTFTFRTQDYFRTLESECSQLGLRLAAVPVQLRATASLHECPAWQALAQSRSPDPGSILGCLLVTTGMNQASLDTFVAEIAAVGAPYAVLDEEGERRLPYFPGRSRGRLFAIASSPRSGAAVGRFLIGLGHRRVAYLSPLHASRWSQARLEGLTQVFASAGGSAFPCVRTDLRHSDVVGREGVEQAFATVLEPLMRQALALPQVSAWVCASDSFALTAMDCLKRKGLQVPGDISVVGFDDSYAAFIRGLTSHNFNGPAYVRAMLRHILQPSGIQALAAGPGPVVIDGYVTPRRSTGPASVYEVAVQRGISGQ